MVKEERFTHILKQLDANSKVLFDGLALDLGVSEDTVRRDIDLLSRSGLLVKVRGGAISPAVNPLAFQDRHERFADGKRVIGRKVQPLLTDVHTVFIDGGTTMLAVVAHLPLDASLRIITNNLALIPHLAAHQHVEIVVLGGTYNRLTQTNLGIQTCQEAQKFQADLYLMGACAIDSQIGVTSSLQEDGEVKRAMIQCARKVAVLSNQEKLDTTDYFKVTAVSSIDVLITDLASTSYRLDAYRNDNLTLM